ncbi:hypothetical protein GCM10008927_11110 [Amylibacter ulvae]|uniref:Tetratricopeptide repeat protein n=1 Tax=Paramylibacter ulvae TaxID=1651968 RepID=A0ABQ3CWY5_9RHOB|nr:hypothetical protein [Amylibacter ulvae]GHA47948.1 hypothetical protein GCM10008927_11110 [Amylibacter ulvae]
MLNSKILGCLAIVCLLFLAGCESAEERAEKHYQAALTYLADGDEDRAIIEFRNVFQLNGLHKDARLAYARLLNVRGPRTEAYGQYLRLVEQFPDNFEGLRAVGEIALETKNWNSLRRHATRAAAIDGNDLVVKSLVANLQYYDALVEKNERDVLAATAIGKDLIAQDPTLVHAHRLVIGDHLRQQNWEPALRAIDDALAHNPDMTDLFSLRLGVLIQLDRKDDVEQQLKNIVARYPNDPESKLRLIRWYIAQQDLPAAESYFRTVIAGDPDNQNLQVDLINFIAKTRGDGAALDEINSVLATAPANAKLFQSLKASLQFESGDKMGAIDQMRDILQDAPTTANTNTYRLILTDMLIATGQTDAARILVNEVLSIDKYNASATKHKARWQIAADQTAEAIVNLRGAVGQHPNDAELLTLIASAHDREGSHELKSEMLSLAVKASDNAPDESLRYAGVLMASDKVIAAEDTLLNAHRQNPEHPQLLIALGNLYVTTQNWRRLEDIIPKLNALQTPGAVSAANNLTTTMLRAQDRSAELAQFMQQLAATTDDTSAQANATIIDTFIRQENYPAALAHAQKLEQISDDPAFWQYVQAGIYGASGDVDAALAIYNAILAKDASQERVWVAKYQLQLANDLDANATLTAALNAVPNSGYLQWINASNLEHAGDYDGAIAVYEKLYEQNSKSVMLANNLASLLSNHRDDAESLQRAYTIARRLRDTKSAPAQDTYGWIAYLRGDYQEAYRYLFAAAHDLPEELAVQYHLAKTLAALSRDTEALLQFQNVEKMLDADSPQAFNDDIKKEILRLTAKN